MDYEIQFKIYNDKKLAKYLREHSEWYKYLNRSADNYKLFLQDYKKQNREERVNKFSSSVDTIDKVNTIFKIIN